jgi:hypothetical protein
MATKDIRERDECLAYMRAQGIPMNRRAPGYAKAVHAFFATHPDNSFARMLSNNIYFYKQLVLVVKKLPWEPVDAPARKVYVLKPPRSSPCSTAKNRHVKKE